MALSVKTYLHPQTADWGYIELNIYNRKSGYNATMWLDSTDEAPYLRDALRKPEDWESSQLPVRLNADGFHAAIENQPVDCNFSHEFIPIDKNDRYRIAMAIGSAIKRLHDMRDELEAQGFTSYRAQKVA